MPQLRLFFAIALLVSLTNGFPKNSLNTRIVGGRPANPGEVPYQVSLRTLGNSFYCGGAIIGQSWTLTAAHCVDGEAQNGINVVAGTNLLNSGGVVHQSLRYVMHPGYDDYLLSYDVAVIQNQAPFTFTALVSPISLGSEHVGGGQNAIVSGWGGTGMVGPPWPNALQILTTTTITNADCQSRLPQYAEYIFDHKICTFTQSGQGICQGDSGGGLVIGPYVIGIVSWNIPCARGWPDAFIRVSSTREWILQTIS